MTRNRSGFTLVELTVVVVLGALVLGAVLQVLLTNQRTYTAQGAAVQGQQTSRMAVEIMFNELRELSPADGDILSMSSTALTVRLMRKLGIACEVDVGPAASPPRIRVLDPGGDHFEIGDTVLVFAENREATANDDRWLRAEVLDVDSTVTCVGNNALDLEVDTTGGVFSADSVRIGAPVRTYRTYAYQVANWTISGTSSNYLTREEDPINGTNFPWPIAGPLRPGAAGLQFIYHDALGNVTTTPADVRQIEVRIRTGNQIMGATGDGGMVSDSLDAWIYTRN